MAELDEAILTAAMDESEGFVEADLCVFNSLRKAWWRHGFVR